MSNRGALIIMARPPVLGKVKTRLAAGVGEKNALIIYEKLLEYTFSIAVLEGADTFVFWSEPTDFQLPGSFQSDIQKGNDLGERMSHAFEKVFQQGYHQVVMIGTDCPDLSAPMLQHSLYAFEKCDLVIGPALDGGYYLIGMNALYHVLLENMPWSTSQLMECSIIAARKYGLAFITLPTMNDVDEVSDLPERYSKLITINK
jgi:uncharacterized protein